MEFVITIVFTLSRMYFLIVLYVFYFRFRDGIRNYNSVYAVADVFTFYSIFAVAHVFFDCILFSLSRWELLYYRFHECIYSIYSISLSLG